MKSILSQRLAGSIKTFLIITLTILAAIFITACSDGCSNKSQSSRGAVSASELTVTHLAESLPAATELALVINDLEKARLTLQGMQNKLGAIFPVVQLLQAQLQSELGINLLSENTWQQAGFNAGADLLIASLDNRPVIVAPAANPQNFEQHLIAPLQKGLKIDGPIRNEKIGDLTIKYAGNDPVMQMAWVFHNNMVIIALPVYNQSQAPHSANATLVVSKVASTTKDQSLAQTPAFQRFQNAMSDSNPLSFFVGANYLDSAQMNARAQTMAAYEQMIFEWLKKNSEALGFGFNATDNSVAINMFSAVHNELLAQAKAAATPSSQLQWTGFGTDKTLLAARTSIDFPKFWDLYLNSLPDDQRRHLRREIQQLGNNFNLNFEEQLLANLSGNASFFFYGANIPGLMHNSDDWMQAMTHIGMIVSLQFADRAKLDNFINDLMASANGVLSQRPLHTSSGDSVEDIIVIEIKNLATVPGKLYIKDNVLSFATAAFAEESVHEYLIEQRPDPKLADVTAFNLGASFVSDENINGLYFNAIRANNQLGSIIPMPALQMALSTLEEALFNVEVTEHGIEAGITIDLIERD